VLKENEGYDENEGKIGRELGVESRKDMCPP
jgi:hypothetical protein